jgi:hypothetical protein
VAPREILRELETLAGRLGVAVRFDVFEAKPSKGRGGLCRVRGKPMILVDAGLSEQDKIAVMAEALARFDLEAMYVPPALRARIERG